MPSLLPTKFQSPMSNGSSTNSTSRRRRRQQQQQQEQQDDSDNRKKKNAPTAIRCVMMKMRAGQIRIFLLFIILLLILFQLQGVLLPYYYFYAIPTTSAAAAAAATESLLLRQKLHAGNAWKQPSAENAFQHVTSAAKSHRQVMQTLEQAKQLRQSFNMPPGQQQQQHISDTTLERYSNDTADADNNIDSGERSLFDRLRNNDNNANHEDHNDRRPKRRRRRPHDKIVYLLHIHKSGGTSMCQMARANFLSASENNCNVQRDQRCCGKADSPEAQTRFANSSKFDFVASEGRMYEGMDVDAYQYILVLRKSQERYFSHWKHARRYYYNLPGFVRDDKDNTFPEAAGGRPPGAVKNARGKFVSFESQHGGADEARNSMMDLVRENKQQRAEQRQAKLREIEAWRHAAEEVAQEQQQQPNDNANNLLQYQNINGQPQQQTGQHQPRLFAPPKEEDLEDFTLDAEKNKGLFFPHRRRRLLPQKLLVEDDLSPNIIVPMENPDPQYNNNNIYSPRRLQVKNESEGDNHELDTDNARVESPGSDMLHGGGHGFYKTRRKHPSMKPPPIMPHPAEDPENVKDTKGSNLAHFPLVGKTFADWWMAQPDNWSFRQLCGTHCQGIPKYQLTLKDWAYTLERFLQFDTVLFLEDLQTSVDVLAQRVEWNRTNIAEVQAEIKQKILDKAIRKEWHRRKTAKGNKEETGMDALKVLFETKQQENQEKQERQNPAEPPREQMHENWDPLLSVLDDALYDIGQRWEALKQEKGKLSHELTSDELVPLIDIRSLPEELRDYFHMYMEDQEGNHRHECLNECCANQCSAW